MLLEAMRNNQLPEEMVTNFMCIAHHASGFDKDVKKDEEHHGVFQISSSTWCQDTDRPSRNLCNMSCSDLHDDNLEDDVRCAATIASEGYDMWNVWKPNCSCRDLKAYLDLCLAE
ncbi:lysozyme C-like [Rhinoderma darwinii]|uniref:lysozyme C-like n=1 Tax=Rhinoderma darwinii TaxID=43563 RepID=UPI003F677F57